MSDAFAKNNNPEYFRFIELAKDNMGEAVFPLDGKAAVCCAQVVLRMVREEYLGGGEEKLKAILNISVLERRARKRG